MKLKCVIIDDEPLAINVIKKHVDQIEELETVATFTNAVESLKFLHDNQPDLIFLDVNMPVLDGFKFLESLNQKPMVIITSAHAEHAIKGFELEVLDYLLKPISFPRFLKSVNKAIGLHRKEQEEKASSSEHIFVKVDKKKMKKICFEEIIYVESLKDYIKIITKNGNYVVHSTLSSFTDQLPADQFIRIHRSITVSIDKIDTVEGNSLEIGGQRFTIGRSYIDSAKEKIFNS
ncbi:LytR/AlgR family response regulator transcription factor [Croceivirga radicis]|uniref:DNA-binding response regulator n=1 Tax=Croceivirga radicis TaxID=1929488 RepID=A0A1V6LSU0_9FLAO|nr:response regulator transcription factor [Croceivirga radicis]OQD43127.1 DNA-binding response regulator [Croceivirga radicis]